MLSADITVSEAGARSFDPAVYREAMSRFPTGVAIVTTHDEHGRPHGFTASSFCSVSLEPPLVLVCLARSANSYPVFARSRRFAVSILRAAHTEVATRFASKHPDKFAAGGFVRTSTGASVLHEALAAIECRTDSRYAAGDHDIFVGSVERVMVAADGGPAVYCGRGFRSLCADTCDDPDRHGGS